MASILDLNGCPGLVDHYRSRKRVSLNVGISIQPAGQPNRITFDVPPRLGVIIPEVVVIQPTLEVVVLPQEAQVDGVQAALRRVGRRAVTKGIGPPAPDLLSGLVGGQAWGVQVVGVQAFNRNSASSILASVLYISCHLDDTRPAYYTDSHRVDVSVG